MAYNPNLYNPYAPQQFQPTMMQPHQFQPVQPQQNQQPVNGLTFLDGGIEEAESYQMPPGSVSQPLFIDDQHFIIKIFDSNGGSSMEAYKAEKIPLSSLLNPSNVNVTKADLDAFKAEIMEAINGKHTLAEVPAAQAANTAQQPVTTVAANQATGII